MSTYDPNDINAVLSRIEARQQENSSKLDRVIDAIETHHGRLTKLEEFRYWLLGAAAGISAAFSLLGDKIKKLFTSL